MSSQTANPVQLLQLHGDSLRSHMKRMDLLHFCEKLCKFRIVSKQMRETFRSIDCERVEAELRVRYLFNLICYKISEDKALFSVLLIVLSSYNGEIRSLYKILSIEYHQRTKSMVGEAAQVQDLDRCLIEGDIPDLVESLASGSHKWEEISIALKFPLSTIEDIRIAAGSSVTKLNKVFHAWVSGNFLKPVNLSVLKNVLAKSFVGLPSLADNLHLEDIFPAYKRSWLDHSYSDSDIGILCQSVDASVSYGNSTLLEVQVNSCHSSVSYQWFKDGHELLDDGNYENINSSILLVRHRNMASKHIEGYYICQVEGRIKTDGIPVKIHYSGSIRRLLDYYEVVLEEVPKDSWPPRCAKSFVELALINRNSNDVGEYDYSVRRDMDDIIKKKDKIEYYQAFGRYESGALVLVEGRPGCGKTTLAHKVTRDWSRGEKVLVGAELVFIVSLRILNVTRKDKDINELMKLFYCNKEDAKDMGQYLLSSQGDKVCFIFDGLDEYHKYGGTFVEKLIYHRFTETKLLKAMVIIFSRPVGTWKLKQSQTKIRKQIEILGFKKDQIHAYIDSYFNTNPDMAHGLKEYLDLHINVLHMCYLPVHASMICYLYSRERDNLPTTETQIYTQFTTYTIARKLRREDKSLGIITLANLSETDKKCLLGVCKLAFNTFTESIQIFRRSEVNVQLYDKQGSDAPCLGLVTVDRAAVTNGYEDFYSFLHLTFQEYLAAYFIYQSETEKQSEILERYMCNKSMVVVWKFYCGLIGMKPNSSFQNQIDLIVSSHVDETLFRVHCAFESQQSISCDAVLKHADDFTLSFWGTLNLADCHAICHVISNASQPTLGLQFNEVTSFKMSTIGKVIMSCTNLQILDIRQNFIGSVGAAALAEGLKSCTNLQNLDIRRNNIGSDGAAALAEGLKSCTNLQNLDISMNNICSDGAAALANGLKSCTNLQTLYIGLNKIGSDGAASLAEGLKCCTNLHTLDIRRNNIGSDGAAALAEGLKFCTNLQNLYIFMNNICSDGAAALAEGLKSCTNLQNLDIGTNSIGSDCAAALAEGLKSCTNLQNLDISINNIGSDGAAALAEGLKFCTNLQNLSIFMNNIGSDGAAALAEGLKSCTNLQNLDIGTNSIGSDCAAALAEGLKSCTNLQNLDISMNNIGSDGTAALAEGLKSCTYLQNLDISMNNIGSDGTAALAEGLKYCTNLQTLHIGTNNIGSGGAGALAEGLKSCTNLQTLNISENDIGSDGAAALAEGLKSCTNLQSLHIGTNNIGSDGAAALAESLKSCTNLQNLYIGTNNIGSDGAAALAEGLKFCTNLDTLYILQNDIGSDGAAALAEALKSCINLYTQAIFVQTVQQL